MTNFLKFGFEFSMSDGTTASQIIAMLDPSIAIQAAHAQSVRNICETGETYSGQIGDVLGAAWQCAANGRTTVRDFETSWVELMLAEAASENDACPDDTDGVHSIGCGCYQ